MKLHLFHTDAQPPLCGQKERTGRHFLPQRCTTTDQARVQCRKCLDLAQAGQIQHLRALLKEPA